MVSGNGRNGSGRNRRSGRSENRQEDEAGTEMGEKTSHSPMSGRHRRRTSQFGTRAGEAGDRTTIGVDSSVMATRQSTAPRRGRSAGGPMAIRMKAGRGRAKGVLSNNRRRPNKTFSSEPNTTSGDTNVMAIEESEGMVGNNNEEVEGGMEVQNNVRRGLELGLTSEVPSERQNESSLLEQVNKVNLDLVTAKREAEEYMEKYNELKVKYEEVSSALFDEEITTKALRLQVDTLTSKVQDAEMTLKSMERLNDEISVKMETASKGNRFRERVMATIDRKYLSFALAVEKEMLGWSCNETLEIKDLNGEYIERSWKGRMEIVNDFGIPIDKDGTLCVPTPFEVVINSTSALYIPTYSNMRDLIKELCLKLMEDNEWAYISSRLEIKKKTLNLISNNQVMISRLKQLISDCISNRKRQSRDALFCSLEYFSLCHIGVSRQRKAHFDKKEEISRCKRHLIRKNTQGIIDFGWWRSARIEQIHVMASGKESGKITAVEASLEDERSVDNPYDEPEPVEGIEGMYGTNILGLLKNEISTSILHTFMGYNPTEDPEHKTETTIMILPRLDAWLVTVIEMLMECETRGGARQKKYTGRFMDNIRVATDQLVGNIREFVTFWAPEELEIPTCGVGEQKDAILSIDRKATRIVHSRMLNRIYIAVREDWFCEYITPILGKVKDCYICRITDDWSTIEALGTPYYDACEDDNDSLNMDEDIAPSIVPPLMKQNADQHWNIPIADANVLCSIHDSR